MAFSLSRPGLQNVAGNDQALFLKIFAGEVLTAFHTANKIIPLGMVRTLKNAKSASFPVTGRAYANWHTVGNSVFDDAPASSFGSTANYLNSIPHSEIEVFADEPIVAPITVADIDEMRNHYDLRSIYAGELGQALAKRADKNALGALYAVAASTTQNAFRTSNASDGTGTGAAAPIAFSGGTYGPAGFEKFCFDAQAELARLGVPKEDRCVVVRPDLYYAYIESGSKSLSKDYSQGNGDFAGAEIYRVAGLPIVMSETFGDLTANNSAETDAGSKNGYYSAVNWSTVGAMVFHKSALATVKMADISIKTDYITERLSTLMLGVYVMGHKGLRPEAAIVGTVSNLTLA